MELPIQIIVAVIVILVVAFVILAYFAGGIGNISKIVDSIIHPYQDPNKLGACVQLNGKCSFSDFCCSGLTCKQDADTSKPSTCQPV